MGAEGDLSATGIERCREAHAEVSRDHSRRNMAEGSNIGDRK
jgi:hypothetical protein